MKYLDLKKKRILYYCSATGCVWISVSDPVALLQDVGTGHPWGW